MSATRKKKNVSAPQDVLDDTVESLKKGPIRHVVIGDFLEQSPEAQLLRGVPSERFILDVLRVIL
jgi:hypothetical protein